jgi:hypothetical protein
MLACYPVCPFLLIMPEPLVLPSRGAYPDRESLLTSIEVRDPGDRNQWIESIKSQRGIRSKGGLTIVAHCL